MNESLFQYIWQFRLYDTRRPLLTTDGEPLQILHPGTHNTHAGPDFFNGKIQVSDTLWAGNIELHLRSSDWQRHRHQDDPGYANIILHVVYEYDTAVQTSGGQTFPTLILKDYIDQSLLHRYERLMQSGRFIPCAESIQHVHSITLQQQLDRMLAERMEEQSASLMQWLNRCANSWQEVFYLRLARSFGAHINQDAFEQLALRTPLHLMAKYRHKVLSLEALLFGQAGFLNDYFDEEYPQLLQQEYHYLQQVHGLQPMEKHQWKFLRLRPANFPTLRIAQFAQLLHTANHLFSKLLEAETVRELEKLLDVSLGNFWLTHYTFPERSHERNKSLGKNFMHILLINAIVPCVYLYGKMNGKEVYSNKALEWLRQLPPEQNAVVEQWNALGISAESAASTQSLLQLKKHHCDPKQCLSCSIGYAILK